MDSIVTIKNLYKIFGPNPQKALELVQDGVGKDELLEKTGHVLGLSDINLEMPRNQIQVIMGLSGSGKSTLIRHINRLIEPTTGEIIIDNINVLGMNKNELRDLRRHKISMVFQKFALFPHRTVIENVSFGLNIQGLKGDDVRTRAERWISRVGLSGYEDYYPAQLSGGMQQRVGLARALTTDADILLMDEAFSALDPLIRTEMQDILLDLQEELHKSIVFITHDLDEALRIGDNIAILRDGMIIQTDDPQNILMKPADAYVADFMKDINRARVLRVRAIMHADDPSVEGPSMSGATTLEQALQFFAENNVEHAVIHNRSNQRVGVLSIADLIRGMKRPTIEEIQAEHA
ncbi:MAG: glycine betaine/L-proline ABC transporter ATP-binding protein [Alphaproteobacteria bacterium]|jgi:glycine betaine/proline transport system ATP-binding protein|nr:glycine betaine/L-proline ABC transporter ATP-binding protein [Alphaproteobacteria bacterium]